MSLGAGRHHKARLVSVPIPLSPLIPGSSWFANHHVVPSSWRHNDWFARAIECASPTPTPCPIRRRSSRSLRLNLVMRNDGSAVERCTAMSGVLVDIPMGRNGMKIAIPPMVKRRGRRSTWVGEGWGAGTKVSVAHCWNKLVQDLVSRCIVGVVLSTGRMGLLKFSQSPGDCAT